MRAAAREVIDRFDAGEMPVDPDHLADWLIQLIEGKAHGMETSGLLARCRALAEGVEDYPARCFTKETRKALRPRFVHVPTDKELIDAIDAIDRADRRTASRCMKILDAAASPAKPDPDAEPWHQRADFKWQYPGHSEEARQAMHEKTRRENRELRVIIEARDAAKRAAE